MVMAPGRSRASADARRIDAHRSVDHQHGRVEHGHADWGEILHRIVGKVASQSRIDRDRTHGGEEQRVTVRLRLCHVFGPDRAVGAWPVVDDDALSEQAPQWLGEQPRHEISGAARRESHHQPDRPVGIILRLCAIRCRQDERGAEKHGKEAAHDDHGTSITMERSTVIASHLDPPEAHQ
jgi:hypothetical protein